ncbi:MAG: TIM barrel protein [Candidatus Bathyarchaeia archaeon]
MGTGIALFGPAGFPLKGPRGPDAFGYLANIGLLSMEYQAVRSIRIGKRTAQALGSAARDAGVVLTLHAPYAINLCSRERAKRNASIRRLYKGAVVGSQMGAMHITFHPGYYGKISKEDAMSLQLESLKKVREMMDAKGIRVKLGPETTGKMSQFGSLEEVLRLSEEIDGVRPTIDFGHLNVRGDLPKFRTAEDYARVFDLIETRLGVNGVNDLVIHFSEVEPTKVGIGERRHHKIGSGFGPPFRPLANVLAEKGYRVIVISESPLLELDAKKMKEEYEAFKGSIGAEKITTP